MNKVSFLILFSLLQCLDCFSQSISEKLINPIVYKSGNEFIAYGFTGEKKATEFNVIKYNSELVEIARYKKLNPNNKWQGAFMMVEGDQLRFVMSGGEGGVILLSASTLEEISFVAGFDKKYSDEYNKKFSSDSSKYFFDLTYCIYNYQYVTEFDPWGTAIMPFLIKQAPSKSPSFKTSVYSYANAESKLMPEYRLKWKKALEHRTVNHWNTYLLSKELLFLFINDFSPGTFGQYFYSFNNETGAVNYKIKIADFEKEYMLFPGNAFFDASQNTVLVAGSLYAPDKKNKSKNPDEIDGYFLLKLSSKGEVIAYRKISFPEDFLKLKKSEGTMLTFPIIQKKANGNYLIGGEYLSYFSESYAGMPSSGIPSQQISSWLSSAFTFMQLNDKLETVDSLFVPREISSGENSMASKDQGSVRSAGDNIIAIMTRFLRSYNTFTWKEYVVNPSDNNSSILLYAVALNDLPSAMDGSFSVIKMDGNKIRYTKKLNEKTSNISQYYFIRDFNSLYKYSYDPKEKTYKIEVVPID